MASAPREQVHFVTCQSARRFKGVIMREHGKAETVDQPAQQQQACSTCGHTSTDLTVLDTCSGKSYRPFRCDLCKSLAWVEE